MKAYDIKNKNIIDIRYITLKDAEKLIKEKMPIKSLDGNEYYIIKYDYDVINLEANVEVIEKKALTL